MLIFRSRAKSSDSLRAPVDWVYSVRATSSTLRNVGSELAQLAVVVEREVGSVDCPR